MSELPFVSSLIVVRNEKNYIEKAILSLICQDYPKDKYEIIIVDGISTDGSMDIVKKIINDNTDVSIRVLNNEKKILATGWNIGIKASKGDFVIRIDAHAEVDRHFFKKNIETIQNIDADCVGGKLITKPMSGDNPIVSMVLSSPFGVGNSSFRVSNKPGYADTAVYGLYKKSAIERAGFFDERFVRNQDIELHSRIKKNGGKFYFNPEICSYYYSRSSVKKMLRQNFGNGLWNMVLLKHNPRSLSLRHLFPFLFLCYLLLSIGLGFLTWYIWALAGAVLVLHYIIGFVFSLIETKSIKNLMVMPFLFFLLHLSYGFGYFCGIFKKI